MRIAFALGLVVTGALVMTMACSSAGGSSSSRRDGGSKKDMTGGDMSEEDPPDLSGTPQDFSTNNGSLVITSFTASPSTSTSESPITFNAVVETASGDEVVSIAITDTNQTVTYGTMSSTGFAGSYSKSLSWAQISAAQDLTFTGGASRTFKVVVVTANDETAQKTTTVAFSCDGLAGCSGQCVDTAGSDNSNCGGCGIPCSGTCSFGACGTGGTPMLGACVAVSSATTRTCSDVCSDQAKSCVTGGCSGTTFSYFFNATCGTQQGTSSASCTTTFSAVGLSIIDSDTVKCCCQ